MRGSGGIEKLSRSATRHNHFDKKGGVHFFFFAFHLPFFLLIKRKINMTETAVSSHVLRRLYPGRRLEVI